jgi:hypothetical protein
MPEPSRPRAYRPWSPAAGEDAPARGGDFDGVSAQRLEALDAICSLQRQQAHAFQQAAV